MLIFHFLQFILLMIIVNLKLIQLLLANFQEIFDIKMSLVVFFALFVSQLILLNSLHSLLPFISDVCL